jgi:hypothetical protein
MRLRSGFLVVAVITLAVVDQAEACSCRRNPTAKQILTSASAVFTGVVTGTRELSRGRSATTFRVTESFKGTSAGATVRILHPSGSSASCGVRFAPGSTHTLSAHGDRGARSLSATLCSTWMFQDGVGLGPRLIADMRRLRGRR